MSRAGVQWKRKLLWGFDHLEKEPLHISIAQEMRNACESFKTAGNHPVNDFWEVLPDGNPSLFRLPVCDSDAGYVDVVDFKRTEDGQNKAFPASCGTWRSDEVQDFMEFTGLSNTSKAFERGDLRHLYFIRIPLVRVYVILR